MAFSCVVFAQTDTKTAAKEIYSGKHHEGTVQPHDLSGVWMASASISARVRKPASGGEE